MTPGPRRPPAAPASPVAARERALRLLSIRARGRQELARALEQRGFEKRAAGEALDRLEREGWLDDLSAARSLVRSKSARYGRTRLERELAVRGFSRETAAAALASREADGEESSLARVFERLWRSSRALDPARRRARVRNALLRRGFAAAAISAIMKGRDEVE